LERNTYIRIIGTIGENLLFVLELAKSLYSSTV